MRLISTAPRPVEWVRVRERGVVGFAPAPDPEPIHFVNVNANHHQQPGWLNSPVTVAGVNGTLGTTCTVGLTTHTPPAVRTVAAGLNSGQVSRLIRIARDWSKQAELVSSPPAEYPVEGGAVLLDAAPRQTFAAAYTSFLLTAQHRLVPSGNRGEHAWFRAWRHRAARVFLAGATADAIMQALRHELAALDSRLASARASAPHRFASTLLRLAHFIAPNAPPALLQTKVSF
jgi:hypothetical protein